MAMLLLAGCAAAGPPAGLAEQEDGKSLTTKPGMGRLYVVHGDQLQTPSSYQATAPIVGNPVAAFFVGAVAGALNAATERANREPPRRPAIGNIMPGHYFLDGQPIANLGNGDYAALDLPPGTYIVRFEHGTSLHPVSAERSVAVEPDKLYFIKSMVDVSGYGAKGTTFFDCSHECLERVREGRRIVSDWRPKAEEKVP